MIKIEKPRRDIELEIIEAEIKLACLRYENYTWLNSTKLKEKGNRS